MKITCQSCQSKYTVSDEKVQGKTVKIKCRKCGATILVNSGGVTTSGPSEPVSAASGGAADAGTSYLVNVADGDQRTMTLADIVAAYNGTVVTADTYVWADGMGDWQPLGQVEAIVAALNNPSAAPAPDASASQPPQAAAEPEPEHRAAARRDPGRGARDLFGAHEVPAAAPSYNGAAQASVPRALPSAPMSAPRAGDENSMLFSLSALTAKPSSSGAPKATTARDREDSGIIDLRALAAAAAAQSAPQPSIASVSASAFMPDGGLFPLGAPPSAALAAPPVVTSMPPQKSKTPIFLGLGAVVAVAAIAGAFIVMRGGGSTPAATAATVAATAPTAEPSATASATPSASASADASAVASASAAPDASAVASANAKAGKAGKAGPGRTGPAAPRGPAAAPAAPAAPAPAAPAAPAGPKHGNCGCAAGDLMCAMKCSAK